MPELPEVEQYRRLLEAHGLRRRIAAVEATDGWYLKRGTDASALRDALVGRCLSGARRRGKLLLADVDDRVLGLRFGMSGRLVIDGRSPIERLLFAPVGDALRWDRFALRFDDGGDLRVSDPRRLGGVELDVDLGALGPDALGASLADLRGALGAGTAPLKARLLDQSRLAGVGNLVADELLWRAGLSPLRAAGALSEAELRRLHRCLGATLSLLLRRGGSHTGDLAAHRRPGGTCPTDGTALCRDTVGGRTTWWCPVHQR